MSTMKSTFMIFIGLLASWTVISQNMVELRLNDISHQNNVHCYDIELRSDHSGKLDLAGQNYRLFYNSEQLILIEHTITSRLSTEAYTSMDVQLQNRNGQGFASLSFDATDRNNSTLQLNGDGKWESIGGLCFQSLRPEDSQIIWADELTKDLATASITLSEWTSSSLQSPLNVRAYNTFITHSSNLNAGKTPIVKIYPNPVTDYLQIQLASENTNHTVALKDMLGRILQVKRVSSGIQNTTLDMTRLPIGSYTLDVSENDLITTSHIIVKSH